jgi:nickel/cobalt transporter (NicO) family protein
MPPTASCLCLALGPWEERFVDLGDSIGGAGSLATAAAVLLALLFGAVHSLGPGHGKAVVGAYLLGHGGRARDAVAFGASVAAMHTASVLLAGGALYLGITASVQQLLPWMSLASGMLVVLVGAGMLTRQLRVRRDRSAAGWHAHPHDHGRHRAHDPVGRPARASSRPGLLVLGLSGGLLPSPSAFLVLATAIFAGKAVLGFLLVAAFSIGLAATLTGVGLAAVRGHALVDRWGRRTPRWAAETVPLLSAAGVLSLGLWVTMTTLSGFPSG